MYKDSLTIMFLNKDTLLKSQTVKFDILNDNDLRRMRTKISEIKQKRDLQDFLFEIGDFKEDEYNAVVKEYKDYMFNLSWFFSYVLVKNNKKENIKLEDHFEQSRILKPGEIVLFNGNKFYDLD